MKKYLLLAFIISFMFSCTSQEEKKKKDNEETIKSDDEKRIKEEEQMELKLKSENHKIILSYMSKYNFAYEWDTLKYFYSINYKQVIETPSQLIIEFEINDIYEKDNIQFVSLKTGYLPLKYFGFLFSKYDREFYVSFDFDLSITKEQSSLLESNKDLALIVSVSEIIKKPKTTLFGDLSDENSSEITLETFPEFSGKGKLIDIIPLAKKSY